MVYSVISIEFLMDENFIDIYKDDSLLDCIGRSRDVVVHSIKVYRLKIFSYNHLIVHCSTIIVEIEKDNSLGKRKKRADEMALERVKEALGWSPSLGEVVEKDKWKMPFMSLGLTLVGCFNCTK